MPFVGGNRRVLVHCVSAAILVLITWLDYVTGYEFGFFIFYFIPVSITAWFTGRNTGLAAAVLAAACWFLSDRLSHHPYSNAYFVYWETFMRFASFLTTAMTLAKIRSTLHRERRLNRALELALERNRSMERFFRDCPDCGRRALFLPEGGGACEDLSSSPTSGEPPSTETSSATTR